MKKLFKQIIGWALLFMIVPLCVGLAEIPEEGFIIGILGGIVTELFIAFLIFMGWASFILINSK